MCENLSASRRRPEAPGHVARGGAAHFRTRQARIHSPIVLRLQISHTRGAAAEMVGCVLRIFLRNIVCTHLMAESFNRTFVFEIDL